MTNKLRCEYVSVPREVLAEDPTEFLREDSAAGYCRRASARRRKGRIAEALSDYDEAIQKEPNNVSLYRMKAMLYYRQGDLTGASAVYSEIAELHERQGDQEGADEIRQMLLAGLPSLSASKR